MMSLPLTKTLDPADYRLLGDEFARVMETGTAGQNDHRRWEYSMALRAIHLHRRAPRDPLGRYALLDVGGAGSPFAAICQALPGEVRCTIIDPHVNVGIEEHQQPHAVDAVVSISVIEHVARPERFLRAIHRALAPGGLLFLTMDCWDQAGPDKAHFHWMRQRIYNRDSWQALYTDCVRLGFHRFGGADWDYHGSHLYGEYSFCSLCLVKKES